MARTDFYILKGNMPAARFSCSIAGKALAGGHTVYLLAADEAEARRLDDLLWTYQDTSFLPHALAGGDGVDAPIQIGMPGADHPGADVLINLTDSVPDCAGDFSRIVEIIDADPARRDAGRERYRVYRERGYELHKHDIDGA